MRARGTIGHSRCYTHTHTHRRRAERCHSVHYDWRHGITPKGHIAPCRRGTLHHAEGAQDVNAGRHVRVGATHATLRNTDGTTDRLRVQRALIRERRGQLVVVVVRGVGIVQHLP